MIRPESWMATIFLTRTTPVSISTVTSANWQPPTPTAGEAFRRRLAGLGDGGHAQLAAGFLPAHDRLALDPELAVLELQVVGVGLNGRGDLLEEGVAGLGDRVEARGGHRRRGRRTARRLARRERRVADVGDDVGRLEPQDLGGDDRQDRPGAGADILGGGFELDRAIRVDRAD